MRRRALALPSFFLTFALAACGSDPDSGRRHYVPADDDSAALSMLREASADCGALDECHPSVGLVAAHIKGRGVSLCTGFLVGEGRVATNAHCLPPEIAARAASGPTACAGSVVFALPGHFDKGLPSVRANCARVLFVTARTHGKASLDPDFAVFEIDQKIPGRPSIGVDRNGVPDESPLKAVVMSPSESGARATMKIELCRATQRSRHLPWFTEAKSAIIFASSQDDYGIGCRFNQGNSGSPMLNSGGKAVAILHGGPKKGEFDLDWMKDSGSPGIATNLACVPNPADLTAIDARDAACDLTMAELASKDKTKAFQLVSNGRVEKAEKELIAQATDWANSNPSPFRWKLLGQTYSNPLLGSTAVLVSVDPACSAGPARRAGTFALPRWKLLIEFDPRGRLKEELLPDEPETWTPSARGTSELPSCTEKDPLITPKIAMKSAETTESER